MTKYLISTVTFYISRAILLYFMIVIMIFVVMPMYFEHLGKVLHIIYNVPMINIYVIFITSHAVEEPESNCIS